MKAMRLRSPGGLDNLQLFDGEAARDPGPGEVRVRLHASSLNYHDYSVASRPDWKADGRIPMSDGAGVIEAVGAGVAEFATGDRVVSCFFPTWEDGPASIGDFATVPGDGVDGYAREAFTGPASCFTLAPRGYSHAEAATLTTAGLTAWRALVVEGDIKAGDSVLVLGTGGVSIFALQFAKLMGATVIVTSSSDAKLERARALGADATINYKAQPEWGARVRELTSGRGVDHVVEVGGPGTLPQSIAAVRIGGRIVLIGVLTGRGGEIPTGAFMLKQARLQGVIVGSRREQRDMVRALDASGLRPVIDRTYALGDLAEAFRLQEQGAHFGKICVEL